MSQPSRTEIDPAALAGLRERLIERRASLRADVDLHRAQLVEPAAATGNTFVAGSEGAVADADDEIELALWRRTQRELDEVEAALQRVDAGCYGDCLRCGAPIGLPRLSARPEASLCLPCQDLAEKAARGA